MTETSRRDCAGEKKERSHLHTQNMACVTQCHKRLMINPIARVYEPKLRGFSLYLVAFYTPADLEMVNRSVSHHLEGLLSSGKQRASASPSGVYMEISQLAIPPGVHMEAKGFPLPFLVVMALHISSF